MKQSEVRVLIALLAFNCIFYMYLTRFDAIYCNYVDVKAKKGVIMSTLISCLIILGRLTFTTSFKPPLITAIFMLHFQFVYAFYAYRYLRDVQKKCNVSRIRDVYYYYYAGMTFFWGISLILTYVILSMHSV